MNKSNNGLVRIMLLVGLIAAVVGSAQAEFKICKNQTYALCAAARCTVYNGVAYCQCEIKSGDSISLPFKLHNDTDVCSVNALGANNRYMVSTFSLPNSVLAPNGDKAVYTCAGGKSEGAYAQCDGGLCFVGTEGTIFPGFDKAVPKGQIICSCPITKPKFVLTKRVGHQIMGPYPCQKSFFQYCNSATANEKNGSTIYVGAPTGIPHFLTKRLNGTVPALNECHS